MVKEFATYEIGGKTYVQKTLVLAQIKQIINLMQDLRVPENLDPAALIFVLGERLSSALAIVLVEKGTSIKDKDIEALATELEFDVEPDVAIQIIEDFFCSNQIASLLERVNQAVEKMKETLPQIGSTT